MMDKCIKMGLVVLRPPQGRGGQKAVTSPIDRVPISRTFFGKFLNGVSEHG